MEGSLRSNLRWTCAVVAALAASCTPAANQSLDSGDGTGGTDANGGSDAAVPSDSPATSDGGGGPAATVYGSSHGASVTTTVTMLAPKIMRVYDSTCPAHLGGQAASVPAGVPMHYSCKPSLTALAAHDATLIASLKALIAEIPEVPGARVTIQHEYDNNAGAVASDYQAGWAVFLTDVVAPVNAARSIKLISVAITTPGPYTANPPTMDAWYVTGADEIGTDAYSANAIKLAAAYALAKHHAWSMPEYGYSVAVQGTDAQILARMKSDHAFWSGVANPPRMIAWYDAGMNDLANRPLSAAWWKTLTTTGVAAP